MQYVYRCEEHGAVATHHKMGEQPKTIECPLCGGMCFRDYRSELKPVHYNSQGFHNTDYGPNSDKLELLNRTWSKAWGEPPPPPSKEVPRNSSEKH